MSTRPARSTSTARSSATRLVRSIVAWVSSHSVPTSTTESAIAQSTMRENMERRPGMGLPPVEQSVARAPDRLERRLVEPFLELAPQPADIDVDDVGLRIEVHLPYVAQQHLAG